MSLTKMRRLLFVILMLALVPFGLWGQRGSQKELTFVYIDHTIDIPVGQICDQLKSYQKDALNLGKPYIFYLANMKTPIVAKVYPGCDSKEIESFDKIIGEIQGRNFHDIDSGTDVSKIIELFDSNDFLTPNGQPKYSGLTWEFYINQKFWDLEYNEKIIGELCWSLDIGSLPADYFRMKICYCGDDFQYDRSHPFGVMNACPEIKNIDIIKF